MTRVTSPPVGRRSGRRRKRPALEYPDGATRSGLITVGLAAVLAGCSPTSAQNISEVHASDDGTKLQAIVNACSEKTAVEVSRVHQPSRTDRNRATHGHGLPDGSGGHPEGAVGAATSGGSPHWEGPRRDRRTTRGGLDPGLARSSPAGRWRSQYSRGLVEIVLGFDASDRIRGRHRSPHQVTVSPRLHVPPIAARRARFTRAVVGRVQFRLSSNSRAISARRGCHRPIGRPGGPAGLFDQVDDVVAVACTSWRWSWLRPRWDHAMCACQARMATPSTK